MFSTRLKGLILAAILAVGLPASAMATTNCIPTALPNILTNGTTADATKVMADFNSIISQVQSGCLTIANNLSDVASPTVALANLGGVPLAGGNMTGTLRTAKGADIASAATTSIFANSDGNYVHVTGTTTITSFGTATQAGEYRLVEFTGALTLTNNANIIIPGGANYTTAAGDMFLFVAGTTTVARVVGYALNSGKALISSATDGTQIWGGTSGGSATAQTISLPVGPAAYTTGMEVHWASGFASGAGLTLAVNGLAAKTVVNEGTGAIVAGDFASGQILTAVYTGTQFQLVGGNNIVIHVTHQTFSASTTYTPHAGMLFVWVRMIGGGGAGGGTAAQNGAGATAAGGGGQAGAYSEGLFSAATIGASQTVTIGAAGAAGTAGNNPGGNGGTSSLGAVMTATGGTGGAGNAGSASLSQLTSPGSNTTVGTGGYFNQVGNLGQLGVGTSGSSVAMCAGGNGGNSQFGSGGLGFQGQAANSSGAGGVGQGFGSGGGGACGSGTSNVARAGGGGVAGYMDMMEFDAQ